MTESGTAHSGTARPNSRGARRRAREFALQGIYGWLLRRDEGTAEIGEIDAHIRGLDGFAEADGEWYQILLHGSVREASALRERFMRYVDRPIDELSPIEHAVLLIGSYELVYHIEVPYRAIINEAVELAKSFGGTDGFRFVNGVLDKLAAEVRATEVNAAKRR